MHIHQGYREKEPAAKVSGLKKFDSKKEKISLSNSPKWVYTMFVIVLTNSVRIYE